MKTAILLAALVPCTVSAAMPTLDECQTVAARFAEAPTALSVFELDTLRICAAEVLAEKIRARKADRNHSAKRYEDSE